MESEGVSLPLFDEHPMMPWNDLRKGDCCGRYESQSDGYYCKLCVFFVHKKCGNDDLSEYIDHPSHPDHTLELRHESRYNYCDLCGWKIAKLFYRCDMCDFDLDLHCAKRQPPNVIDNFETHPHKLILLKNRTMFDCSAECGKARVGLPYKCDECDVSFHVDCVWHPEAKLNYSPEVNHPYHSLHPLKLLTGPPPDYSDGKCRLCGRKVDKELFYHCSSCNFTLDMPCVLHPPPQVAVDLKAHDHQLTLLPRLLSFTCNACGLKGDRSPYMCVQCDFMIHQDCIGLPRVININRHDHRVSRTLLLGVVDSVCGVCRKKVDWTCGGFSCKRCPGYVVHSKCATRGDVWNGKELEGVPEEEEEDTKPYVEIDENTIQHFSHKVHYLRRIHGNGVLYEENKRCSACTHPVGLHSFYTCVDCDFSLHQKCAECPKRKRHVLHNERLTLDTNKDLEVFRCDACYRRSNGFMYKDGDKMIDVLCGSISEPFVHPSHPHHPLYYIPTENDDKICNGCNRREPHVLRCIEGDCGFVLCFECATEPKVVKHRVDDHPLSLCYGEEEEASGKYWCDICEKETDSKEWFYTCKDQRASLHRKCVLGDSTGLMPRTVAKLNGESFEVVLNNSVTRPFCKGWSPSLFSNKGSSFSKLHPLKMSRHPEVKWAETTDKIFLTVVLADSKETKVNLDPEGAFDFSAEAGPENHVYELKLELHGKVNVEESKINIGVRSIFCIIEKAEPERWNKLIGGGKAPHYVKIDCDKWVDEDDEGSAGAGDMDMGGMGGMDFSNFGGMGGMEGLGGMGGLGGMAEVEGLGGMGGMGGMEEFEDSDDEGKEFAKPGDKKDEAVKEEAKPVDVVKEDK
ncbi:unnamed protein product [Brassica napus]|uniref:Co-chaperone protein p23-1 n=1 Tax=Brassica napus TaxID=3708 RepID=A0A816IJ81_BRANA|nr:unnamed protein product [Brassica napus]